MDIVKTKENTKLTLSLTGRLDAQTSPQLAAELALDGVTELVFDLSGLEYVSSAGLRIFLQAHRTMMSQGQMIVANVTPVVKKVLDLTGFGDIFTFR